jgi:hypothetical protein
MNSGDARLSANQLAADIEATIADVDNRAMPGTFEHHLDISATLYENLPKIRALIGAVRADAFLNRSGSGRLGDIPRPTQSR